MADGEINRNGATIRIDDNGGVQVEPAEGQEVEYTGPDRGTDAIRDSVNTGDVNIGNGTVLRSEDGWKTVEGTDADDRLDTALSEADRGDAIYLERAEYTDNRTISNDEIALIGTLGNRDSIGGTMIEGDWTFSGDHMEIQSIVFNESAPVVTRDGTTLQTIHVRTTDLSIDADDVLVWGVTGGGSSPRSVTFEDGTSGGAIALTNSLVSVSDNGDNTAGVLG